MPGRNHSRKFKLEVMGQISAGPHTTAPLCRELHGPVVGEENAQMNAMNLVLDAYGRQRAAFLLHAGQIDTDSAEGAMFALGRQS